MPDTLTAFFGITKPALHSTGWGPKANTDYDQLDSVLGIPRAAFVAPTIGATTTLDLSLGSAFRFSLTQGTTIAITNPAANPAGVSTQVWQEFRLILVGDGTRRTVTWPGSISWLSGQVPVLTPGGTDYFVFITKDNGATWLGLHRGVSDQPPATTVTYTPSGTTTIPVGTGGGIFKYTVATGASTIVFGDVTANTRTFRLFVTNGGLFTQTWPGSVVWLAGTPPPLQASGVDELEFTTPDGGTTWYGLHVGVADVITSTSCKANRSASLSVSAATETVVPFTAADSYDTAALHDPASNPSRITVPAGGWPNSEAEIVAQVTWVSNQFTLDHQTIVIRKNANGVGGAGTELARFTVAVGNDGVVAHPQQCAAYDFAPIAGDYYEVFVITSRSGGNSLSSAWVRVART